MSCGPQESLPGIMINFITPSRGGKITKIEKVSQKGLLTSASVRNQ